MVWNVDIIKSIKVEKEYELNRGTRVSLVRKVMFLIYHFYRAFSIRHSKVPSCIDEVRCCEVKKVPIVVFHHILFRATHIHLATASVKPLDGEGGWPSSPHLRLIIPFGTAIGGLPGPKQKLICFPLVLNTLAVVKVSYVNHNMFLRMESELMHVEKPIV